MRFKDEKPMWYSDTEKLSQNLANKTAMEIQKILDGCDVIRLESTKRSGVTIFGRLLFPFVFLLCIILTSLKWIITGDRYLDSTAKKYNLLGKIFEFTGIR